MATTQMTQTDMTQEVQNALGIVPHWFADVPENSATHMWGLMRDLQLGETKIPNKYKELIGLGISAATRCQYCTHFHTEAAKLNGATDEEIAEANAMAGLTMAFSTFLNGQQVDYDRFVGEMAQIVDHVRSQG